MSKQEFDLGSAKQCPNCGAPMERLEDQRYDRKWSKTGKSVTKTPVGPKQVWWQCTESFECPAIWEQGKA